MSDEGQNVGKLLADEFNQTRGNPSDGLLTKIGEAFPLGRSTPPPVSPDPAPTPIRSREEILKESRGGHDIDKLADHLSRFQLAEDGRTLIDPVAEQAEAAAEEKEVRSREWFTARKIEDPEWHGEAAAKIIQFTEANFTPDEAAKMQDKADNSHSAFEDLFKRARKKERADMIEYGRAEYPETYKNFQSAEEREFEAARKAEKEQAERVARAKERLRKEMQSSDPAIRERAQVKIAERFVK